MWTSRRILEVMDQHRRGITAHLGVADGNRRRVLEQHEDQPDHEREEA